MRDFLKEHRVSVAEIVSIISGIFVGGMFGGGMASLIMGAITVLFVYGAIISATENL